MARLGEERISPRKFDRHFGSLAGFGDFIEFESHQEVQVARLRQALEIEDTDLVGGSYCDLASKGTS